MILHKNHKGDGKGHQISEKTFLSHRQISTQFYKQVHQRKEKRRTENVQNTFFTIVHFLPPYKKAVTPMIHIEALLLKKVINTN